MGAEKLDSRVVPLESEDVITFVELVSGRMDNSAYPASLGTL
jgi:hypothetical protein